MMRAIQLNDIEREGRRSVECIKLLIGDDCFVMFSGDGGGGTIRCCGR